MLNLLLLIVTLIGRAFSLAADVVQVSSLFLHRHGGRASQHLRRAGKSLRTHASVHGRRPQHPARELARHPATLGERAADGIAAFAGSWLAVGLHAVWFALWLALRLDINVLTLIVSLEAIFLSIFLLLSGERKDAAARAKSDVEAGEVDLLVTLVKQNTELTQQVATLTQAVHELVTTKTPQMVCHATTATTTEPRKPRHPKQQESA